MKQGTFEKEIFIKSEVKTAIDLISDYSQHHNVHPLIVKVEQADNAPGVMRRYFITDSLQWGPFKFKIKYRADIIAVTEDTVHTQAFQSPNTFVENITKVTPADGGIILRETVTLRAPDLLFNYAFRQAEAAHGEMLERIKRHLESQDGA